MDVYVGAKKSVLEALLELALAQVRESTEGAVSVTVYSTVDDSQVTFSDEDTEADEDNRVTIETFA